MLILVLGYLKYLGHFSTNHTDGGWEAANLHFAVLVKNTQCVDGMSIFHLQLCRKTRTSRHHFSATWMKVIQKILEIFHRYPYHLS